MGVNGPEGLSLGLYDTKEVMIQETKTYEKGLFKFLNVNPGDYVLKPLDDINLFDKKHNELKFRINLNSQNFLERALIIRGFTVSGKVLAEYEPIQGISAYIYSYNSTLMSDYNCDYGKVDSLNENVHTGITPF